MSKSIWPLAANPRTLVLDGDLDTSIVIIGAGISGLTAAVELARRGRKPVVIDAGMPGAGETHNTTAHLASAIDDRFVNIARWHGEEGMKLAYRSHAAAIDKIEENVNELGIECDFARVDGFLFAENEEQRDFLLKELEASHRAGFSGAKWQVGIPLEGLEKHFGIRFPHQARFNPGLYIDGLLRELAHERIPIYRDTRIQSWEKKGGILLKCERGHSITCSRVIFACNDPFVRFKYYMLHGPYRTYAISLEVPDEVGDDGLYWDLEDPYHYVRFAQAAEGGGRVLIVGGEDHKTGQKDHPESCWDNLESWARSRFPFVGRKTAQWSGQVLETMDGLAFIGPDAAAEGKVFLISGDSGMGITHGTLGGVMACAWALGEKTPYDSLYDPARFHWSAFPEFLQENANVAKQYTHVVLPAPECKEDVAEGHGAVIQDGLKKTACIKLNGLRREMTAICPHLGGLVRWNEAEGTWDCECHGSRFTASGEVINGPAVTPLKLKTASAEAARSLAGREE